jgi:hypothetical protein
MRLRPLAVCWHFDKFDKLRFGRKLGCSGLSYVMRGVVYDFRRHVITLCLGVALSLWQPRDACAWIETQIKSEVATIDVDSAGDALVTQDLSLGVRGGPLPGFDLNGVDLDAEPVPGATVVLTSPSKSAGAPIPLLVERRDDGSLRIEVDRNQGLRTGVYLFHFQYRTHLLARGLVRRVGSEAELRWIGPRFSDGIDSARVVFRLPSGPVPPSLPSADTSTGRFSDSDVLGGVFIANLHRLADKDELDVVRPHVARGEPVVWCVRASLKIFTAFQDDARARASSKAEGPPAAADPPRQRVLQGAALGLAALLYGLLVSAKWSAFRQACEVRRALPRALLGRLPGLRAALAGSMLALAAWLAVSLDRPLLGTLALCVAIALAAQFAVAQESLRGPGEWLPMSDAEAFGARRGVLPGRGLDAGSWPGALYFSGLLGTVALGAALLRERAPYLALWIVLGSACLLPVFFSGRASELPPDRASRPRALLWALAKGLRRRARVKVVAWARVPENTRDFDELRLLVQLGDARRGLIAIEVGVELGAARGGSWAAPFVLVRAREGSPAAGSLPAEVAWMRGRRADERVALLRPKLPTAGMCRALVERLVEQLAEHHPSSSRTRSSGGKGASTAKAF